MDAVYELIGRLAVDYLRLRYRRRLRAAAVIAVGSALLAGYILASRDAAEG